MDERSSSIVNGIREDPIDGEREFTFFRLETALMMYHRHRKSNFENPEELERITK